MRYANSRNEAEDMLQKAFYNILRDLSQYSGLMPISAWMRKVTVNTALMHIRKYQKIQFQTLTEEQFLEQDNTDQELDLSDRAQAIIQLVRRLSPPQKAVFNLKAMDEYSFVEISKILDCKESTFRSHYS